MSEPIIVMSDGDGTFSGWEDLGVAYSRAFAFVVDRLKASDFARCGLHGRYKLMLSPVEAGIWAIVLFLANEPSGGASILMGDEFKETMSEVVRFDFNPAENPWDSELFDILLANESMFDSVFFQMAGRFPSGDFN